MSKIEKCPSAGCVLEPRFHAGDHSDGKDKTWTAHPAGCACGPCHNSRTTERTTPVREAANACGVRDGDRGRRCVRERAHDGDHFTGYRLFGDPPPPAKKAKAKSAPKPSAEPKPGKWGPISCTSDTLRCESRFRNADTKKPAKPELRCDLEREHAGRHRAPAPEGNHVTVWDGDRAGGVHIPIKKYDDARDREAAADDQEFVVFSTAHSCGALPLSKSGAPCLHAKGHDGVHSNGRITWRDRKPKVAAAPIDNQCAARAGGHGMRCELEGGHDKSHANGRARWPNEKEELDRVYALIETQPGRTAPQIGRKRARQIKELEKAGRIVWRDEGWWPAEPDSDSRWECGATFRADARECTCEGRSDHNGPHYEWSKVLNRTVYDPEWESDEALSEGTDDDPHEDEIRSDEERDFSRRMREDREAHAAELEQDGGEEIEQELVPATGETITCRGRTYQVHPAARIFPTPAEQYAKLKASIQSEGQKHAIELLDGDVVIDGCGRLRACAELGIEPLTKRVTVADPIAHVIAVNLARRHLNESQRAMAAARLHRSSTGKFAGPTQAQSAAMMSVSERTTRDAERVLNAAHPAVIEAIDSGKLRASAGAELAQLPKSKQREIVEKVTKGNSEVRPGKVRAHVKQELARETVREINEGKVPPLGALGSGWRVALSDPAWPYDNSDQHEGSRGHTPYPGQPIDEIIRLHTELASRMADDAILFLCYTNAFLLAVGDIARAGGWTYRTQITIVKSRTGLGTWPRGRTEHVAILSRGNPVHTLNEITTWLADKVIEMPREHSRKPDELYQVIEKHCGGPRLELYSRYPREGWSAWGAEADGAKEQKRKSKILTATDARTRGRGAA